MRRRFELKSGGAGLPSGGKGKGKTEINTRGRSLNQRKLTGPKMGK